MDLFLSVLTILAIFATTGYTEERQKRSVSGFLINRWLDRLQDQIHENGVCPGGWIQGPTGSCYFLPPNPQRNNFGTVDQSRQRCQVLNEDSHLVSIESEAEQKFLEQLLTVRGAAEWDYWTNGRKDSDGQWRWGDRSTLARYGYVNWDQAHDQPDNSNCLYLPHKSNYDHKWHDHRCNYRCSFICELELLAPTPPPTTPPTTQPTTPSTTPSSTPPLPKPDCPTGWISGPPGSDSCYFVPPDPQPSHFFTHWGANHECERRTADLVSVESKAEQDFIANMLAELGDSDWDFWTSGKMDGAGNWHWRGRSETLEEDGFVNWDEGQPNDRYTEKCIFLGHRRSYGHRWHDHRCSYRCSYICELKGWTSWRERTTTTTTTTPTTTSTNLAKGSRWCTQEDDISYNENDYSHTRNHDRESCERSCIAASHCAGYTYNKVWGDCYLKSRMANRLTNFQGISGVCTELVDGGEDDEDDSSGSGSGDRADDED